MAIAVHDRNMEPKNEEELLTVLQELPVETLLEHTGVPNISITGGPERRLNLRWSPRVESKSHKTIAFDHSLMKVVFI